MIPWTVRGHQVKWAKIDAVTTKAAVVTGVSGKRLVVVAFSVNLSAQGTAQFFSDASTAITGAATVALGGQWGAAAEAGCFATASGEDIQLECTTGTGNGFIAYVEVDG